MHNDGTKATVRRAAARGGTGWPGQSVQRQSIRAAIHIAAVFAIYLSVAMLVPAAVDLYVGNDDWQVFAFCGFFMGALSMAVALATQSQRPPVSALVSAFLSSTCCG